MLNPLVIGTELIRAVDNQIDKIRSRTLDLSFNELLDMHKNGELIISPEYQRLFRWSEGKQSRFIESLLLEMPVPPLYVIEKEDRNSIAHGVAKDGLDERKYGEVQTAAIEIMSSLIKMIMSALSDAKYLRAGSVVI